MSGSKKARNVASIVSRQNVCGGPKKAGLAPLVGIAAGRNNYMFRRAKLNASNDQCGLPAGVYAKTQRYTLIY